MTILRYVWGLLAGALVCVSMGVFFVATPYWPFVVFFLYGSVLLAWRAWAEMGRYRRRRAENEWWGRQKRGIRQEPLTPCCTRFGDTGNLHDEIRCTSGYTEEQWVEQALIDATWDGMIANLGDLDREEEGK